MIQDRAISQSERLDAPHLQAAGRWQSALIDPIAERLVSNVKAFQCRASLNRPAGTKQVKPAPQYKAGMPGPEGQRGSGANLLQGTGV